MISLHARERMLAVFIAHQLYAALEACEAKKMGEDYPPGRVQIRAELLESALPALLARVGNGSEKLMEHWLRSHSFAHDAAKTAAKAGVERLALSHLIPSDDPDYGPNDWIQAVDGHWDGQLFVGYDGLRIEL